MSETFVPPHVKAGVCISPPPYATKPNISRRSAGSNWNNQQTLFLANTPLANVENVPNGTVNFAVPTLNTAAKIRQRRKANMSRYVAMDCEMVGVGYNGHDDMLARVSIVNRQGVVLLDKFVKAQQPVVDYRTSVSGIRPHDMENGEDFVKVQKEVVDILQGKILVGHAIRNDLAVLHIRHPYVNIRDTSSYKPLCALISNGRTPSLKRLSAVVLGQEIQTGEHNSVEDARAAMFIYNKCSADWERSLRQK